MMLRTSLWICAVLSVAVLGCTSEPPAPAPQPGEGETPKPTAPAAKSPKISLAPTGDPTPPLDGGRVQSNMPEGWKFLPRANDYLFAAYYEEKAGVPRLVLRQADSGDLPQTTSAEEAKALAAKITEEVGSDKDAALTVVNVGDNWFVRYEKVMSFRSQSARGVFLETVRGDKRYSIELLTYTEEKDKFLPALYRFAADLKVEAASAPEAAAEAEENPEPKADEESNDREADETPAEEE
ncbi:hypothetical protein ACYFX5_13845 [Bremerella sp. T1]|uniref:hypothetical protein n=1 Tax=Bremerella sp. TYQ1 TaxID=3119568 RepID=UPI001CCBE714|nr:hypothetical protein [Bremerella volcania]UBM34140.1 hypothetical protein LA756_15785 [Bremerella volcania]